jgi:hypothetical protein
VSIYLVDPIGDLRWTDFVNHHCSASVYHSPGWLQALHETYGYQPFVLTTSQSTEEISNGVVFCQVRSIITGRRLVSLPFSDHCQPLVETEEQFRRFLSYLAKERDDNHWKYVEVRLRGEKWNLSAEFSRVGIFHFHDLDLRPTLEQLFCGFHKDSVQRKIRRAEREGLSLVEGTSDGILEGFYSLIIQTRRRHGLPPQPKAWFQNLRKCLPGKLTIHLASKDGRPVAGILTLRHNDVLSYKYGGSDAGYHNLGGMQALFWKVIQQAKGTGIRMFDLGRTDRDDLGLVTFKNRLGARLASLSYYRYPQCARAFETQNWKTRVLKEVFAKMSDRMLSAIGNVFYRHIG